MKSNFNKLMIATGASVAMPLLAFAQTTGTGNFTYTGSTFQKIIQLVQDIIGAVFPIITAILVLYFAYEIFKFMKEEGADKAIYKGRVIQALLALFVWFTFFGIIQILAKSAGLGVGDNVNYEDTTFVKFN
jgi:TRAP-type C4-dicarboxylate transport system permease small subunit